MPLLAPLLVLVVAAAALWLIVGSLGWPMVHDPPVNHYIGWRLLEGDVPFRDTFDNNFPGVHLFHAAVLQILGPGDAAWRAVDLFALAASAGLITAYGRRIGTTWSAAGAALIFVLFHLAAGAGDAGQRDYMLVPLLLIGAYGVARHLEQPSSRWPLVAAGLAMGATVTFKPFPALFGLALLVAIALPAWPSPKGPERGPRVRNPFGFLYPLAMARRTAPFVAAGLVAPALVYGWLASIGAFGPFWDILTGYTRPYYGPLWQRSLPELAVSLIGPYVDPVGRAFERLGLPVAAAWAVVLPAAAVVAWAIATSLKGRMGPWLGLALVGVGYGLLHYVLQGKGWEYHTYPLMAFVCVTASALLAPSTSKLRPLTVGTYAVVAGWFVAQAFVGGDRAWVAQKVDRVESLVAELRPLVPPGERVQVMDVSMGGLHALLKLQLAQPTRFVYDLQFYHPLDANVRAWRSEFIRDLKAAPPVAMVLFRDNGVMPGFQRIESFPELKRMLETQYRVHTEQQGYRVYTRR